MEKKLLNIFVCILLVLPVFSLIGSSNQLNNEITEIETNKDNIGSNNNLTITLKPLLFFLGVKIIIKNTGEEQLSNINWAFNSSGGLIIRGGEGSGIKEKIKSNRRAVIRLLPIPLLKSSSPVGIGRVEIEATAEASNGEYVRTTAEAFVFGRKILFFKDQGNTAKYKVTFNSTWSEETHPDDFPSNPHFSGLIGASHNDKIKFWKKGEIASPGIKNMAETGSKSPLDKEIYSAIFKQKAFKILSGDGIGNSPGSTSLVFKVSEEYPLVSLVSMIAPSPDWFVGVDSLNLFENGSFISQKTVVLYAYDSGTDSGTNYTSPDDPTEPPEQIFMIETSPFLYNNTIVPVGFFTFTKI
jgi:hypothetical protein